MLSHYTSLLISCLLLIGPYEQEEIRAVPSQLEGCLKSTRIERERCCLFKSIFRLIVDNGQWWGKSELVVAVQWQPVNMDDKGRR